MKVIEGGRGEEVRETHAGGPRTAALAQRAAAAFPDARLTAADTRPFPVVMARGARDRIYDVDGREYLDFHLSSGALVAGHAHPDVQAALRRQVEAGGNFGAMNEAAIDLAERIVAAVPSIDSVKLVVSGTEATLHAIRMARAYTGRDLVLRFEGAYHGHLDMVSLSNKLATLGPADRDRSCRTSIRSPTARAFRRRSRTCASSRRSTTPTRCAGSWPSTATGSRA